MARQMTDREIVDDLRRAYASGCSHLVIHSRRQDVGIMKCERGVSLGLLRFVEHEIDDQETHWRYYWTDKAHHEFRRANA